MTVPLEPSPRLTITLVRRLAESTDSPPPAAAWAVTAAEAAGALPVFDERVQAGRAILERRFAHQRGVLEGAAGLRDRAPESLTDDERATLREAAALLAQRYRVQSEDEGLAHEVARLARGGRP